MRCKKLRNPRASQIRHNKHKTTMTSPTSKKYNLSISWEDLDTICDSLEFLFENFEIKHEHNLTYQFISKLKNTDKITKEQFENSKKDWLKWFDYETTKHIDFHALVKLKKRLYKKLNRDYYFDELEIHYNNIKSMTYKEALSKISS